MEFSLTPVLVQTDEQWETLRVLRNKCREAFTHNSKEISKYEQSIYATKAAINPHLRHYLYLDKNEYPVGFSRLEWIDGYVYPTMGVDPLFRGNGYGKEITKLYMIAAGGPLKGDFLRSNKTIEKIDYQCGWIPSGPAVQGVQPVQAQWPPTFLYNDEKRQQEIYDEIIRYQEEG